MFSIIYFSKTIRQYSQEKKAFIPIKNENYIILYEVDFILSLILIYESTLLSLI